MNTLKTPNYLFYKDIFICDLKVDNILYLLPFIKQIKTKTCIRSQIWNIISCNITVSIGTSNLISIILAYTAFSWNRKNRIFESGCEILILNIILANV